MTGRPLILVYGNCQAEAISAALSSMPQLSADFDIQYICSFRIAGQTPVPPLSAETLARAAYLFEQATAKVRFEQANDLPASTMRVTFVSLDFNPLWPLHAVETRSLPEPPDFPFGRFPYGDRAINSVVVDSLTGQEGYEAYMARSTRMLKNIGRVLDVEKRRWSIVEKLNGSNFLDWLLANFTKKRLFHSYNHPSQEALAMVAAMALEKSGLMSGSAETLAEEVRKPLDFCWRPDVLEVPVHPVVASEFDLEWWSPGLTYKWHGAAFHYEPLIKAQIEWRSPG